MLRAMKQAGCSNIGFGIESGSQAMLDSMNKGTRVEQAATTLAWCREAGITSHAFFLIGLPGETAGTLKETLAFARQLPADFFDIHIAYPLPNTAFYEMCQKEGLWAKPLEAAGYAQPAVRSRNLSAPELEKARKHMLLRHLGA